MAEKKKTVRLFISPQTHIRATKGDGWMFAQTEEYLKEKYPNALRRRNYLQRYNDYKKALREEAERAGFAMPVSGAWIKFYIPVPQSWSNKKKIRSDFEPHTNKPDIDNFTKAIFDGLLKEDKGIWDVRVSKYWYNGKNGFIEIILP